MSEEFLLKPIAHIKNDFKEKFGIPRQSGLVEKLTAQIIFEDEYAVADAVRGLQEYSHLWLIWQFSKAVREDWSPTVRPPRLGGNTRIGVFATRSPYRPNPIGLSVVRIENICIDETGKPVITVLGADLLDGTPIYDIKPYLPYADCIPEAEGGFTAKISEKRLKVECEPLLLDRLPEEKRNALLEVLSLDPRPSYHNDPNRVYGMSFANVEVKFKTDGEILTVTDIVKSAE